MMFLVRKKSTFKLRNDEDVWPGMWYHVSLERTDDVAGERTSYFWDLLEQLYSCLVDGIAVARRLGKDRNLNKGCGEEVGLMLQRKNKKALEPFRIFFSCYGDLWLNSNNTEEDDTKKIFESGW